MEYKTRTDFLASINGLLKIGGLGRILKLHYEYTPH